MKIEDLGSQSASRMGRSNRTGRWDDFDPSKDLQDLLDEKEKVHNDAEKIKKNEKLMPRDKIRLLKSTRNLSCTINTLLERSKDRLTEYYDSQLREKSSSPSRTSALNPGQSRYESKPGSKTINLSKRL